MWWRNKPKLTLVETGDISSKLEEKTRRISELQERISLLSRENTKLRAILGQWERWFKNAPFSIADLETKERTYHGNTLEN